MTCAELFNTENYGAEDGKKIVSEQNRNVILNVFMHWCELVYATTKLLKCPPKMVNMLPILPEIWSQRPSFGCKNKGSP